MGGAPVILIAGPTTAGKSALALDLARALGGALVNADSMQVYRDLSVLTARPSPAETESVPHRLYGHVDGADNFSVARFVADAGAALAALDAASTPAILVGGTGLYLRALTEGLSDMPPISPTIRAEVRALAADLDTPSLHAELARRDPAGAARLRPSDRMRTMRALEVFAETGRTIASFQDTRRPGPLFGRASVALALVPDRAITRRRIDERFRAMMERGALGEVEALAARRLDPLLPVMRAHGVPGLLAHLAGGLTLEEAIRRGQADTRAYAKRQETWLRTQLPSWPVFATPDAAFAHALARTRA